MPTAHHLNLGQLLVALIEETDERKQRRSGKRPEHKEGGKHDRLQSDNSCIQCTATLIAENYRNRQNTVPIFEREVQVDRLTRLESGFAGCRSPIDLARP